MKYVQYQALHNFKFTIEKKKIFYNSTEKIIQEIRLVIIIIICTRHNCASSGIDNKLQVYYKNYH